MRIVIDIEGLQGPNFNCSVIKAQILFLKALIKINESHEIDLIQNGNFVQNADLIKLELGEIVKPKNFHTWYPISSDEKLSTNHIWNKQASELIREALITKLQPNFLLTTNLTRNLSNDILLNTTNFNNNNIFTAVLYETTNSLQKENIFEISTARHLKNETENLNNPDFIVCLSEAAEKKCLSILANTLNKTVLITNNDLNDSQVTKLALATINQLNHTHELLKTKTIKPQHTLKKRLAYVSPLPPDRTDIADYSTKLLPELSQFYDIDVISVQQEVISSTVEKICVFASLEWFYANSDKYDQVIYHFGDSTHYHWHMFDLLQAIPGIVVLHDFYLSGGTFRSRVST